LQTALYVFESKGLPLNLSELIIKDTHHNKPSDNEREREKGKFIENVNTRKIMGDITKELFKNEE